MSYKVHGIHTEQPRCKNEYEPFQCQRILGHTGDHGDPWPTTTWPNELDSGQWCRLHGLHQDDPRHRYDYDLCESHLCEAPKPVPGDPDYWEGWGTARGHRGPIGAVGIPCEHEYTCTKCGMLHP